LKPLRGKGFDNITNDMRKLIILYSIENTTTSIRQSVNAHSGSTLLQPLHGK